MKKNRLYSLSVLVIGVLISVSLLPLHINAQSLTSPFLGINMQVTAYGENASSITLPKINIEYIGSTVPSGYISGQLNCTTPSSPSSSTPCDIFQFQNTSGQSGTGNGTRIYLNLQNYLLEANGNATINHQSYFFIDYEFILDDNYKGYVTFTDSDNNTKTVYVNGNQFHYSRMQLSISEVTITIDDYQLTRISNPIMWLYPFESYTFNYLLFNKGYEVQNIIDINAWKYPIFSIPSGSRIEERYVGANRSYYFIIGTDLAWDTKEQFSNFFTISRGEIIEFENINVTRGIRFIKFRIGNITTSGDWYISVNQDTKIIGILSLRSDYYDKGYFSTEFMELYGIGGYQNSSEDLNDINSQFQTDSNSLISIEDSFNNSMNNALQNVSPTFNMNQSFLNSANWVSTQFNRIVNNTPFASLITFGLTLGLGLLIIGKVRK